MTYLQQIVFDLRKIEEVLFGLYTWMVLTISLPILAITAGIEDKMSMSNLEKVMDADLKKRMNELIDIYDWTDKCTACGRPDLLYKGPCTR